MAAYDGKTSEQIQAFDIDGYFPEQIGLITHLSPSRGNGLSDVAQIQELKCLTFLIHRNKRVDAKRQPYTISLLATRYSLLATRYSPTRYSLLATTAYQRLFLSLLYELFNII